MKFSKKLKNWFREERRNMPRYKGNWRYIMVWPLVGATVAIAGWGITLDTLRHEKNQAEIKAILEATDLSRMYAKLLGRSLEKLDELTAFVKFEWERSPKSVNLSDLSKKGVFSSSHFAAFLIIDADGKALTSTLPADPAVRFDDRAYFQYHKTHEDGSLRVGTPQVGRLSGKRAIHLTRRLNKPDGSFAGVLVVGVAVDALSPFSDKPAGQAAGLLGVAGTDGVFRIAVNDGVTSPGADSRFSSIPQFGESAWRTRILGKEWFVDGERRYVASDMVPGYPFRAVVGLDESQVLAPHKENRANTLRSLTAGTVILAFFVGVAMLLSSRLLYRKAAEEEERQAYRLATESGNDGFYSWRAIYDDQNAICDFEIVDCNERGAALYNMDPETLRNMTLRELYPSEYGDRLIKEHVAIYEAGFIHDEVLLSPGTRMAATWLQRKIVRTRDGLAVTMRDITEAKEHEQELTRLATVDSLTGLPNRHWLTLNLPSMLASAQASNTHVALLCIDLDNFKNVNDSQGHTTGDALLIAAAKRLQGLLRPGDHVARLGGDEFTIVLNPVTGEGQVSNIANRVISAFRRPFSHEGALNAVGTSIGISVFPRDAESSEALLKNADIAMYAAKETKGSYRFYTPKLFEQLAHRIKTEQELNRAMTEDEFLVFYQPRAGTLTGKLVGMEALVRWKHPTRGMVPPLEFIPTAEASDTILKLGAIVMDKTCAQIAEWRAQGLPVVPVSVNVSARQFNNGDVKGLIKRCLLRHGLEARLLEIELTESTMMAEREDLLEELAEIASMGVKVHIDDFGTGYSSLSMLQSLSLDVLKVDRAFTSKLDTSDEGVIFFKAIVSMAHALGMSVVAEGVENVEQLRVLQDLGCDEVQGYYLSKPVPAEMVPELMGRGSLFPQD